MAKTDAVDISRPPDTGESPALGASRIRTLAKAVQEEIAVDHYIGSVSDGKYTEDAAGEHARITIRTLTPEQVAVLIASKAYIYRLSTDGEFYFKDDDNNTIKISDGGKIRLRSSDYTLANNTPLKAILSGTPTATVDMIKVNASDKTQLPDGSQLATSDPPTSDAQIANKKYIDDSLSKSRNYIFVQDKKTAGTAGGAFTSGDWRTRTLNQEVSDDGSHCTLASNQITLVAGTYEFRISCPAFRVDTHQSRLYNITTSSVVAYGTSEYSNNTDNYAQTRSFVCGKFTISESNVFEVQHRCEITRNNNGLGVTCEGFSSEEVYTIAEFWRI